MWLLTAVGPVHGQRQFTFVLEKNKAYKIGRDKSNDICFQSKVVRPREGTLEVGDWNAAEHTTPPTLVWKPEQKKSGGYFPAQVLSPLGEVGSTDVDEYAVDKRENVSDVAMLHGSGLKLGADSWFTVRWEQLHISYDKMKNEEEEFTAGLRKCCVSWTAVFQPTDPAEIVVSGAYKSSQDCYFAVCYGLPIVSEQWLYTLENRFRACWKKVADSEDSFSLPDAQDERFRPPLDPSLRNTSATLGFWIPRPGNRTLFNGWHVIGLKTTKALTDKRYYIAMGAEWSEIEVLNPLPLSPADFLDRIAPVVDTARAAGRQPLVMFLPSAKKDLLDRGVNFESVVHTACDSNGIALASGAVLWKSVVCGSVEGYLEAVARPGEDPNAAPSSATAPAIIPPSSAVPPSSAALPTAASSLPAPTSSAAAPPSSAVAAAPERERTGSGRLTRRAGSRTSSRAASRAPSVPPAAQPDAVPSTFPEDTEVPTEAAAPKKDAPKKPLKRRAGREPKPDTFDDMDVDDPSQASAFFPSQVQETQGSSGSQPPASLVSRIPDSVMDIDAAPVQPSLATSRTTGKLKRRAGVGATQSSFLGDIDTSVAYEEKAKETEKRAKYSELYESNAGTLATQPAFKRARTMDPETQRQQESNRGELMQIDEENDFVSRALKSARHVKRERESPSKAGSSRSSRQPSPSKVAPIAEQEEPEQELQKRPSPSKKPRGVQQPGTQVTKDEKFLQAIATKARSKKEMDELDKEFNLLRIPKPNTKAKAKPTWEPPDYSVLKDFDEDMRGNFIEIVKKDLFRKDKPKAAAPVADDGRPNFKKFKKKNIIRRQPVTLVLSAQHAQAEMGEPYWEVEAKKTQRQPSQSQRRPTAMTLDDEYDEDVPLVPRSRKQLLTQIPEDNSDDDILPIKPPARRRGETPLTQTQSELPTRARRVREASAVSETSSAGASAAAPTRTQRARRGTQTKPLLIDDSDDDNFATAPTATVTRSSRTRGAAAAGTSAKTSTLAPEPETMARGTRSTQVRGTQAASTARRKLLVDDDDDDIEFKGVQKKRRLR